MNLNYFKLWLRPQKLVLAPGATFRGNTVHDSYKLCAHHMCEYFRPKSLEIFHGSQWESIIFSMFEQSDLFYLFVQYKL